MTVHLISVGTSILDSLDDPSKLLGKGGLSKRIASAEPSKFLLHNGRIPDTDKEGASRWIVSALASPDDAAYDGNRADALAEVTKTIQPELWPNDFSAEIETLFKVGTRRPVPDKDIVLLICSDTSRGLIAGIWNALALTGGKVSKAMYLPAPSTSGPRLGKARGRVVIARVPGMDAGDNQGFCDAMGILGDLARDLFKYGHLQPGEEFQFGLSGGYKASTPYLIGMAEAVMSVDKARLDELSVGHLMPTDGSRYPVKAYVVHETTLDPIPLPLRRLRPDIVHDELAGFDTAGERKGLPTYTALEGYAYDAFGPRGNETCKLTPFGAGLREFFGVPPEVW